MITDRVNLKIRAENPILKRELTTILESMNECRVLSDADPYPTDVFILDLGEFPEKALEQLRSLLEEGADEVFLTAKNADPNVLVQALRLGAREFLTQPLQEAEVAQALERFKDRRERLRKESGPSKNGRIIDVIGSKGGVGSTTIAVNLATSLARENGEISVALIDLNLLFGEVPLFLDFEPSYHWGEIARNIARLDHTFLMSVLHRHDSGVFVLPSPSQLQSHVMTTHEVIERLLKLMISAFDFIVVDSGHVAEGMSLKILEMSDTVLVVTILSLPCLTNVSRLVKLCYDMGYPDQEAVRIVVNRYMKNSDISLKDAEKSIGKEIFRTVPNDYKLTMSAINQGKVLSDIAARSPVARSIRDLAGTFLENGQEPGKGKSLLSRLLRR